MLVMEVSAMPDMEDMATARGLLTLRLTTVDSAMPVTEVSAMPVPAMEDTPTARGLLTLRLTTVDSAMPVTEVSAMAMPAMEDTVMVLVLATTMASKMPQARAGNCNQ